MRAAWLAGFAALLAGCSLGGTNNVASHTPTPAASPSTSAQASPTGQASSKPTPQPVSGAFGVLVGSQAASPYSVAIVGVDGKVVASASAATPPQVSCANAAGAPVPLPVSMSNSRAYFMDAQGVIHYLAPNGDTGRATSVPAGTALRRAMFAVSPDDQRVAVIVNDYTSSGASTRLYVEDLNGGGHHLDLYTQSGVKTLWPVGWHGANNLVLAVVPSCTQGGGPFCCGMQELHVVDPDTATRRFTLGSTTCPIAGAPSSAGAVCEDRASLTQATVLNWTGGTIRTLAVNGPAFVLLSPSGSMAAMVEQTGTSFTLGAATISGLYACTWIDDTHVMTGGDPQHQPRVAEVTSGQIMPVPAEGDCGGRLPGGL